MAQIITKSVPTATTSDTVIFDLGDDFVSTFDALSEARYMRMEWEKKEKALKAEILNSLPERVRGVKFVLRVAGAIRGNVTLRARTGTDSKALAAEWPEAYEATRTETLYDQINPA